MTVSPAVSAFVFTLACSWVEIFELFNKSGNKCGKIYTWWSLSEVNSFIICSSIISSSVWVWVTTTFFWIGFFILLIWSGTICIIESIVNNFGGCSFSILFFSALVAPLLKTAGICNFAKCKFQ